MLMTETDMPQSVKSNLARRQKEQTENLERSAKQLFANLESVASVVEGSDLSSTEDPFSQQQVASVTANEATGNQIWSSETEVRCMPSPPQAGIEFACCCSRILRNNARTHQQEHFQKHP